MPEIAVFLFEHLGVVALALFFAVLIDQISTPLFKHDVNRWLTTPYQVDFAPKSVRYFLLTFLDGILHRIFGHKIFSVRFFLMTCVLSVTVLTLAIGLEFVLYPKEAAIEFGLFSSRPMEAIVCFCALMTLNFFVDYMSNVITISFLRMAARSGRLLDTFLVFVADITLTVTIFTLIYPTGILLDMILNQSLDRNIVVVAEQSSQIVNLSYNDALKAKMHILDKYANEMEVRTFYFRENTNKTEDYPITGTLAFLYPRDRTFTQTVDDLAEYMKILGVLESYRVNEENGRVSLELLLSPRTISPSFLAKQYYTAYRNTNIMRDYFFNLLKLEPETISFSSIYYDYAYNVNVVKGKSEELVGMKCSRANETQMSLANGDTYGYVDEYFIQTPWKDAIEDLNKNHCNLNYIIFNLENVDFWSDLIGVSTADFTMPITPFFVTSFATSILYYVIIAIFICGSFVFKVLQKCYSTPYLDTETRPLTILTLLVLVPVLLLDVLFRSII